MQLPGSDDIMRSLGASWRLMQGERDAVRLLDISADGFWNSFFSFAVAIPPLFVFWTREAIELAPDALAQRASLVLRLAVIEAIVWFGPLLLVAWVLYRVGRADRIAAFVVANNWGSALIAWIILPIMILLSFAPSQADVGSLLLFFALLASLVLTWRLNHAVLGMGAWVSTATVVAFVALSVAIDYMVRGLLALPYVAASPAG